MSLHPKIKELKAKATPINYRAMSISPKGKLSADYQTDLDNRIVNGYLATWGTVNDYGEMLIKGAFAKSIQERGPNSNSNYKIAFLWQHDSCDPLAIFAELEEDDYGLRFKTKQLDDVPNADRTLKQIRTGTLNQFSYGFDYVWDKVEYDYVNDAFILKEVELWEGSVVTIGADVETYAMRSRNIEDEWIQLNEEMEEFIKSVPRKQQLELRQLITRHKSLSKNEPLQQRQRALGETEPAGDVSLYKHLLTDLKIF